MKILIVEDEQELAASIGNYLKEVNYRCEMVSNYASAIEKISLYDYDCIVLDIMLPGGDGIEILKEIKRQQKEDGVIIISAKGSLDDKVKGLTTGADDYLAKPFHLPELAARIHSIIRRKQFENTNTLNQNELSIDLLSKSVKVNEETVNLTKTEYDILLFFISNKNRIISKVALAEHISGDYADMLDSYDYIYAHIKNLKKKLTEAGCDNYLKTVYGTGYKWEK